MVPSFEKRVRAFSIDTSAVTLFIILSIFMGQIADFLPWVVSGGAFIGFYLFPYFISSGQTFGKRIQKIKLTNIDGSDVPIWRVLLREIFKLLLSASTFGLYLVIAFFVMNDKTSRTIHDYIFKTKVIDLEKPTGKSNILGKSESMKKRGF